MERRADYYVMGAALVLSPQLMAGALSVTVWALCVLWLFALGCLVATGSASLPSYREGFGAALGCVGLTIIQVVPLPKGMVEFFAPERVELARRTHELTGDSSWLAPLSLDPGATQLAVIGGITLVAAWIACHSATVVYGRHPMARFLAASAVCMALTAIAHWLGGAERVWGIYEPRFARTGLPAPILNPSHLGAFCVFGMVLSSGLGLAAKRNGARVVWTAAAIACGAVVPATGSRGAILGLIASVAVFILLALRSERQSSRRSRLGSAVRFDIRRLGLVLVVVVGVLAGGMYLGGERLEAGFRGGNQEKLEVAFSAAIQALRFPIVGVGRGAYPVAYGLASGSQERYLFPENLAVQWIVEWGWLAGGGLLVAFAYALFRVLRSARTTITVTVAAALAGLVVHDLVDFSLEMTGIAVPAVAAFALLGVRRSRSPEPLSSRKGAAVVGVGALSLGLLVSAGHPIRPFEASLLLADELPSWGDDSLPSELRTALRWHPLEPGVTLVASHWAYRTRSPQVIGWVNRTMALAPTWPGPHELAARWLFERGSHGQAALEVRESEVRGAGRGIRLACELVERTDGASWLLAAEPEDPEAAVEFLEAVARCAARHGDSEPLDARIESLSPRAPGPVERQVQRTPDKDERLRILRSALGRGIDGPKLRRQLATAHLQDDAPADALRALAAEDRSAAALRLRAEAYAALDRPEDMEAALQRLRGFAGSDGRRLAEVSLLEARLDTTMGHERAAVRAYERALELDDTALTLRQAAAGLDRLEANGAAQRVWRSLCRRFRDRDACARSGSERRVPAGQLSP